MDFPDDVKWTPEAEAKLKNIPYFVRSQARYLIEQRAREEGLAEITPDVVERSRVLFGQ
ncbi:MAG: protochlorophyllide oxidoreductase [Coleofasciculaceae cyanobacterium SM2_3_26]|nr:protochlorophyllide oxidoreductase [Coleofasciculaceae cyanobacterium SM2_3_26]